MRSLVAIATRELRLRWKLLPAAVSLGFFPLLAPAFGFEVEPQLMGLVISVVTGGMVALLTGATVIAADLGSGRLAFFFARPVPWWSIWAGKFSAAVLLALGAGLLAAVPWLALGTAGPLRLASLWDLQGATLIVGWVLVLVCVGHAAGVAFRSRSSWLFLDLALLVGLVLALRRFADPVLLAWFVLSSGGPPGWRLTHVVLALGLVLMAGSAAQMAWGRTDVRRGHRVLSVTLWPALFVFAGSLASFGHWVQNPAPADLNRLTYVHVAPQGPWIKVVGSARGRGGYPAMLLYDVESAGYVGLHELPLVSFSPRGDRAALVSTVLPRGKGIAGTLSVVDLAGETPRTSDLSFELVPEAGRLLTILLGPRADRLAVMQERAVFVYELPSGRLLGSTPAAGGEWLRPTLFLDGQRVRALRRTGARGALVEVVEMRLPESESEVIGRLDGAEDFWARFDETAERLLVFHQTPRRRITLHDGRSGSLLATITDTDADQEADAAFLSDGRIVVAATGAVRVCRRDGIEERRLELGAGRAGLGGELAPGRLYVGLNDAPSESRTLVVDLDLGSVIREEKGLFPALARRGNPRHTLAPRPRPGEPGTSLFVSDDGELVRLNPTTGQRTVLLGGTVRR